MKISALKHTEKQLLNVKNWADSLVKKVSQLQYINLLFVMNDEFKFLDALV